MVLVRCIHDKGYSGSRADVGGTWRHMEQRTISDSAARYLTTTFPAWFVVVDDDNKRKSMERPPNDRAMPAPTTRTVPDLSGILKLSDLALVRRINAGKYDDLLGFLSESINARRANVIRAIKARTAELAG